jgi:Pilus formation protein N terminal region
MPMSRFVPHALAAACLLASTLAAHATDLSVPMDEVKVVTFHRPVATVYVGNPSIADVTVIDPTHVFLLGKSYGKTNLIALDVNRNPVSNDQVTVFARNGGMVTLNRGATQITYSCAAASCQPSPVPGDSKDVFDATTEQISKLQDLNVKAASNQ